MCVRVCYVRHVCHRYHDAFWATGGSGSGRGTAICNPIFCIHPLPFALNNVLTACSPCSPYPSFFCRLALLSSLSSQPVFVQKMNRVDDLSHNPPSQLASPPSEAATSLGSCNLVSISFSVEGERISVCTV